MARCTSSRFYRLLCAISNGRTGSMKVRTKNKLEALEVLNKKYNKTLSSLKDENVQVVDEKEDFMNFKETCQEMTELNADGNTNRGREGEELVSYSRVAPGHHNPEKKVTEEEWAEVLAGLNQLSEESQRGQDGAISLGELVPENHEGVREVKMTLPVRTKVGIGVSEE